MFSHAGKGKGSREKGGEGKREEKGKGRREKREERREGKAEHNTHIAPLALSKAWFLSRNSTWNLKFK